MSEPLWRNGAPTEYGVEVFSCGECWTLAYYLHKKGGFKVSILGPPEDVLWWEHVVVRLGRNKFLDVLGVHTADELQAMWPGMILFHYNTVFNDWSHYKRVMCGDHLYERPKERARRMAERLIKAHVMVDA